MGVPTDHAVYLQRKGYPPPWPDVQSEPSLDDRELVPV